MILSSGTEKYHCHHINGVAFTKGKLKRPFNDTNCTLQIPDSHFEIQILKIGTYLLILSNFLLVTIVRLFGSLRISKR